MLEGEEKLIKEARRGKAGAFERLYNHYLGPIYRFIYMKVSHREEAEDITHEVFMNAWQNIKNYRSRGFPLSSWLYRIARNGIIDHYRLKKNHIELEALESDAEVAKVASSIEIELDRGLSFEKVKDAIRELSHDQQDVILMRFMEELSHDEIAAALDKSVGAVRLIQHRAINELKKILKMIE